MSRETQETNQVPTKIIKIEKPNSPPAKRGDQYDIDGYDVHPNQKKEIENSGAASRVTSRRASGGTLAGAYWSTYRSY
jgi:hypothetical protein